MKEKELMHIIIAILVLSIVISFSRLLRSDWGYFGTAILFALIIIGVNILAKKVVANLLDTDVEHAIWFWSRYGVKPGYHIGYPKEIPVPAGVLLPLILAAFSAGYVKFATILTYETSALKRRVAKKTGFYSFAEVTDWHIAVIGGAGVVAVLLLSFICYWIPSLEELARISAFYAFFNLIPFSKLDGAQIYFGSRVLWTALAIISAIFAGYALLLI